MTELRQNIATKEWVIIARERAQRPEERPRERERARPLPAFDKLCPFCPGNEHQTPTEEYVLPDGAGWKVRVTPNKFPALVNGGRAKERRTEGIKRWMSGIGTHEVIIESPLHNTSLALLPVEHVADVLRTYRLRYLRALANDKIELVTIFKNHGESAGTSLLHPHSQLIATPVVPAHVRHRVAEAMSYFDDHGECVFCRMINDELRERERVVFETECFVAIALYAARSPYNIWILPRYHSASFGDITSYEIEDMAKNLKAVLFKLYKCLGDPDYNYAIASLPGPARRNEFYHWYLDLIPRVTKAAGFELGSGIYVNTSFPEADAAALRQVGAGELAAV